LKTYVQTNVGRSGGTRIPGFVLTPPFTDELLKKTVATMNSHVHHYKDMYSDVGMSCFLVYWRPYTISEDAQKRMASELVEVRSNKLIPVTVALPDE
jgi:hypothetical protein